MLIVLSHSSDTAFKPTICGEEKYQLNNYPLSMLNIHYITVFTDACYVLGVVPGALVISVSIKGANPCPCSIYLLVGGKDF